MHVFGDVWVWFIISSYDDIYLSVIIHMSFIISDVDTFKAGFMSTRSHFIDNFARLVITYFIYHTNVGSYCMSLDNVYSVTLIGLYFYYYVRISRMKNQHSM